MRWNSRTCIQEHFGGGFCNLSRTLFHSQNNSIATSVCHRWEHPSDCTYLDAFSKTESLLQLHQLWVNAGHRVGVGCHPAPSLPTAPGEGWSLPTAGVPSSREGETAFILTGPVSRPCVSWLLTGATQNWKHMQSQLYRDWYNRFEAKVNFLSGLGCLWVYKSENFDWMLFLSPIFFSNNFYIAYFIQFFVITPFLFL